MKSGVLPRMIDPGLYEGVGDGRPERWETGGPHLVLLVSDTAKAAAPMPATAEIEALHDNFDAARGIVLGSALGMWLWIGIGTVVWWFVR